ncbi:MAG TPA: pseudouridine synthase, partial [Symbiobacteriaceae bacterium]|nr:pseudouridine synthase [Symbiobacteriaceae bacterium]
MVDRTRKPRSGNGGPGPRAGRPAGQGGPGERPAHQRGRAAGKPGMGPAKTRVGGVDRDVMEELGRQGLLTSEGRKLLTGGGARQADGRAQVGAPARERTGKPARQAAEPGARAPRPEQAGAARGAKKPMDRLRTARTPKESTEHLVSDRLHKVMAQSGVASRRHSEELIQAGRVTVNGRVVTELGTKVLLGRDLIEVDGRPLAKPEALVYILLNKPKGYVTTLYDPQGRPKVTDLLGGEIGQRVYPVGRLDYDTEGLLLLTNDGQLANALMHPSKEVKKTYIAKVRGVPGPAKLKALEEGVELDDGPTAPAEVKLIEAKGPNAATVSVRIHEGRNRLVRRMFEYLGHEVIHLKRTTLGPLHIKDLAPGQWRELTEREVKDLQGAAGMVVTQHRAARIAAMSEARKALKRRGPGRAAAAEAPAARPEAGGPTPRPRPAARPEA